MNPSSHYPLRPPTRIYQMLLLVLLATISILPWVVIWGIPHETAHAVAGMAVGLKPLAYYPLPGMTPSGNPLVEWGTQRAAPWQIQVVLLAPYLLDVAVVSVMLSLWANRSWTRWPLHVVWATATCDTLANFLRRGSPSSDFYRVEGFSYAVLAIAWCLGLLSAAVIWLARTKVSRPPDKG